MRARAKNALPLERHNDFVEIRGQLPRRVINVIDAVAINQRIDRFSALRNILTAWADEKVREATLITRVNHSAVEPSASVSNQILTDATVRPVQALPLRSKV